MKTAAFAAVAGLSVKANMFEMDNSLAEVSAGRALMEEMDGDMMGSDMQGMKMNKMKMKKMKKAKKMMKKMMRKFRKAIRRVCKKNKVPKMKCKMATKYMSMMMEMKHMMEFKMMHLWMFMGGKYNQEKFDQAKEMYMKEHQPFYMAAMKFGCKQMNKMGKKFCRSDAVEDEDNCNEFRKAKSARCVPWMQTAMQHKAEVMECQVKGMMVAHGYMKGMRKMMGLPDWMTAKHVGDCVVTSIDTLEENTKNHEMEFAEHLEEEDIDEIPTEKIMKWMMMQMMDMMGMDKKMMEMKDKM